MNGLFNRCLGTVVGGVIALAVWYMVVGKAAGVIVLSLVALAPRIPYLSISDRRLLLLFTRSETGMIFHPIVLMVDTSYAKFIYNLPPSHRLRSRSTFPLS